MLYGERLKIAMDYRAGALGRKITKSEVARAAGCSPQNISMILSHARGEDQMLNTESNALAASFLKVNSHWLATGEGEMLSSLSQMPVQQEVAKPISKDIEALIFLVDAIPAETRQAALFEATQVLIGYLVPASRLATPALMPSETQASKV
jgi:hypothetical protein